MFDVTLSSDRAVNIDGSSEGTQLKFFCDGYWYKQDVSQEGIVEYLVSKMLTFTTLLPTDYVLYEYGKINGKNGCRSKNFTNAAKRLITFNQIHLRMTGIRLSDRMDDYYDMESKIKYVLDFFQRYLAVDIFPYLQKVFTLDLITLNEDRHFNNLALLIDTTDIEKPKYTSAPIFDNGKSLLNGCVGYKPAFSLAENVRRVIAKPFSGSHRKMFDYFGKGFSIDTEQVLHWLETEPYSLHRDVLRFQIERYRDILGTR